MFGDGTSNDGSSSSGFGGSGFGGETTSNDCSSNSLGSGLGGYGGYGNDTSGCGSGNLSSNGGYGASDGSGGVHSHLDGGNIAAACSGSSSNQTPSTASLGAEASNDTSAQTSDSPSAGYASSQTNNDNNSTPSNGYTAASQIDSSDHNAGFNLSNEACSNSNTNNGFTLNDSASSSFAPVSQGITGGQSYFNANGLSFDVSTLGQNLSVNYDSNINHYINDTTGIEKAEETLASIDSSWDKVMQWGNEKFVQPVQAAWNDYVAQPLNNFVVTPASQNDIAEALGQNDQNAARSTPFLTESDALSALQQTGDKGTVVVSCEFMLEVL